MKVNTILLDRCEYDDLMKSYLFFKDKYEKDGIIVGRRDYNYGLTPAIKTAEIWDTSEIEPRILKLIEEHNQAISEIVKDVNSKANRNNNAWSDIKEALDDSDNDAFVHSLRRKIKDILTKYNL